MDSMRREVFLDTLGSQGILKEDIVILGGNLKITMRKGELKDKTPDKVFHSYV